MEVFGGMCISATAFTSISVYMYISTQILYGNIIPTCYLMNNSYLKSSIMDKGWANSMQKLYAKKTKSDITLDKLYKERCIKSVKKDDIGVQLDSKISWAYRRKKDEDSKVPSTSKNKKVFPAKEHEDFRMISQDKQLTKRGIKIHDIDDEMDDVSYFPLKRRTDPQINSRDVLLCKNNCFLDNQDGICKTKGSSSSKIRTTVQVHATKEISSIYTILSNPKDYS